MQSKNKTQIIITDIDGTLLDNSSKLSERNRDTLKYLKENRVTIVLATGRSLFSAKKVIIENDFLHLIDFVIFSTGAAIFDVKRDNIFRQYNLSNNEISEIKEYLNEIQIDFMIQQIIPDNHFFSYKKNSRFKKNPDFYKRIEIYNDCIIESNIKLESATQFVAIVPEQGDKILNQIKLKFQEKYSIIKTTSPLDKKSIWIEIFPKNVLKSTASNYLLEKLSLSNKALVTVGNDFNDMDLLKIGKENYLLENAPKELKKKILNDPNYSSCKIAPSNINNGFSIIANSI